MSLLPLSVSLIYCCYSRILFIWAAWSASYLSIFIRYSWVNCSTFVECSCETPLKHFSISLCEFCISLRNFCLSRLNCLLICFSWSSSWRMLWFIFMFSVLSSMIVTSLLFSSSICLRFIFFCILFDSLWLLNFKFLGFKAELAMVDLHVSFSRAEYMTVDMPSRLPLRDDFRIPFSGVDLISPYLSKNSIWFSTQSAISLKLLDFLDNTGSFIEIGPSSYFLISSVIIYPFFERA